MGIIYSVGMSKNNFDVAPNHGRTKFLVDEHHDGENIDNLNPQYNEITGLYYLWKNEHGVSYKGLEHYRRAIWDVGDTHLLEPEEITEILREYDVILTEKYVFFSGTMDRYCMPVDSKIGHIEKMNRFNNGFGDFYKNYMKTHYPSEFSWTNMFVAREEIADEYCAMLFNLCAHIDAPEDSKRFFGYCCEKLWSPWAAFKGLKVYRGRVHVYSNKPKDSGY